MNTTQQLGAARELISAIGGLLMAYGVLNEAQGLAIVGFLLAAASLIYAISTKVGKEKLVTTIRKVLSTGGGLAIAYGIANPEQVEMYLGLLTPIISLIWSYKSNNSNTS